MVFFKQDLGSQGNIEKWNEMAVS